MRSERFRAESRAMSKEVDAQLQRKLQGSRVGCFAHTAVRPIIVDDMAFNRAAAMLAVCVRLLVRAKGGRNASFSLVTLLARFEWTSLGQMLHYRKYDYLQFV